ncbi:glycosyl hydrolase [Epithele typhae]|uniref:glycosyl hydrolase n=1 Tax=Epithele typhae TaxID=378194 RepID=UPI00200786AA|nr:glycosyl hydrolase [Epithele typhae]KAH9935173.1 glycosyl hydrolase [Epithele typhae]
MRFASIFAGVAALLPAFTRAFNNPLIWNDLADLDIRNVNGVYYYSASTMHYSPGAPILRSYDLFNWEYVGHSVPTLNFGSKYDLTNGQRAYVNGIWASFFDYNSHTSQWIWGGCIDFAKTYIYTASAVNGTWTQHATINKCYYDCGLLVDDDGTLYVSYSSSGSIYVAQLNSGLNGETRSQLVYTPTSAQGTLEGTRMYKRNGLYYILTDHPASVEYTLKASSPWGPYTAKALVNSVATPVSGTGNPHQGGIVQHSNGNWYYMAFVDAYPGGRVPVLAPITWGSDNFPSVTLVNGGWGASYPDPTTANPRPSLTGTDSFTSLGPQWEWNHNPDTSKFSVGSGGLRLSTASVTYDLYQARNTLTHRILGPSSTATIKLSFGGMLDGDRAGLVLLRDYSGWVGIGRDNGTYALRVQTGLALDMNNSWTTSSGGSSPVWLGVPSGTTTVWLRIAANIAAGSGRTASFSYSYDGSTFTNTGASLTLVNSWEFFMGYRFGIFNYATLNLGGSVTVPSFTLST